MGKNLAFVCLVLLWFCSIGLSDPYGQCKDILRDGVRDTISSHNAHDQKIARHQHFCSVAKHHDLNEGNFNSFAKDYAKSVRADVNTYDGNAGVSVGPFDFTGGYEQANSKNDMSTKDKEDLLNSNVKKIVDYYKANCGQESYQESLQSESVLLSQIANEHVVKAWRECMIGQTGFFADLIPASTNSADDQEIEYDVMIHWRSLEGTEIHSIQLRYLETLVSSPYTVAKEGANFVKTLNLCESELCQLKSGSSFPLTVIHKNPAKATNIRILAKTNTSVTKALVLVLPKRVEPPSMVLEQPKNAYWAIESYCDNRDCLSFRKDVFVEPHLVATKYVTRSIDLNRGTCEKCHREKVVRFAFTNCKFALKMEVANSGVIIESTQEIAQRDARYFYPFEPTRDFYSRIRVKTEKIALEQNL